MLDNNEKWLTDQVTNLQIINVIFIGFDDDCHFYCNPLNAIVIARYSQPGIASLVSPTSQHRNAQLGLPIRTKMSSVKCVLRDRWMTERKPRGCGESVTKPVGNKTRHFDAC